MTLLIVFIATVNIAFGYGLAVYLGHGQLPWTVGTLTLPRFGSKSSAVTDQVSAVDADESQEEAKEELPSPQVVAEKPVEVVPPAKPEVEQVVVKEPESAVEPVSQATEVSETSSSNSATEAKAPAEKVVAKVESPSEGAVDEAIIPAEAQGEPRAVEPEPVVAVEEPQKVAAADSETPAAEVAESATPVSEEETKVEEVAAKEQEQASPLAKTDTSDQASASEGEVDEKFLEGIAAFQSQLEKQVEEPAADSESETTQGAAAPTDAQESSEEQASSKGEDVLAGIESFRAQLASMQQEPEAVEEEPVEQPAS